MRRHMMDGLKEKMEGTKPDMHHSGPETRPESAPTKPAAVRKAQSDSTRPNMGKAMKHLAKQATSGHYKHK